MNPRQRRGVLFMILSLVAAAVVFFTVLQYVGSVRSEVGPTATIYRAAEPVPAFTTLSEDMLSAEQVPQRWLSDSALVSKDDLVGRRVGVGLLATGLFTSEVNISPNQGHFDMIDKADSRQ